MDKGFILSVGGGVSDWHFFHFVAPLRITNDWSLIIEFLLKISAVVYFLL